MGRIAAAAQTAVKQFRPFTLNDVTDDLRALSYRVSANDDVYARRSAGSIQHIVLQSRGAHGLDGVIQPTREVSPREAHFDRLPDGEFDIVIATSTGPRRYTISLRDRAKLDGHPLPAAPLAAPVATAPEPPTRALPTQQGRSPFTGRSHQATQNPPTRRPPPLRANRCRGGTAGRSN